MQLFHRSNTKRRVSYFLCESFLLFQSSVLGHFSGFTSCIIDSQSVFPGVIICPFLSLLCLVNLCCIRHSLPLSVCCMLLSVPLFTVFPVVFSSFASVSWTLPAFQTSKYCLYPFGCFCSGRTDILVFTLACFNNPGVHKCSINNAPISLLILSAFWSQSPDSVYFWHNCDRGAIINPKIEYLSVIEFFSQNNTLHVIKMQQTTHLRNTTKEACAFRPRMASVLSNHSQRKSQQLQWLVAQSWKEPLCER